jgi:hypothetical protein
MVSGISSRTDVHFRLAQGTARRAKINKRRSHAPLEQAIWYIITVGAQPKTSRTRTDWLCQYLGDPNTQYNEPIDDTQQHQTGKVYQNKKPEVTPFIESVFQVVIKKFILLPPIRLLDSSKKLQFIPHNQKNKARQNGGKQRRN